MTAASIGRLSRSWATRRRCYIYMRLLGREGMSQVGEFATLNANYMLAKLRAAGFDAAYPTRRLATSSSSR
jgi:glycine dehydrogenase subunit 2